MKYIISLYGSIAGAVVPFITHAQGYNQFSPFNQYGGVQQFGGVGYGGGGYTTRSVPFTNIESIIALVQTLLGYAQVLIFLVAIGYFLYAASLFVRGNSSGGREALLYAMLGIVVGLLAFTIIPILCGVFQAGGRACNL